MAMMSKMEILPTAKLPQKNSWREQIVALSPAASSASFSFLPAVATVAAVVLSLNNAGGATTCCHRAVAGEGATIAAAALTTRTSHCSDSRVALSACHEDFAELLRPSGAYNGLTRGGARNCQLQFGSRAKETNKPADSDDGIVGERKATQLQFQSDWTDGSRDYSSARGVVADGAKKKREVVHATNNRELKCSRNEGAVAKSSGLKEATRENKTRQVDVLQKVDEASAAAAEAERKGQRKANNLLSRVTRRVKRIFRMPLTVKYKTRTGARKGAIPPAALVAFRQLQQQQPAASAVVSRSRTAATPLTMSAAAERGSVATATSAAAAAAATSTGWFHLSAATADRPLTAAVNVEPLDLKSCEAVMLHQARLVRQGTLYNVWDCSSGSGQRFVREYLQQQQPDSATRRCPQDQRLVVLRRNGTGRQQQQGETTTTATTFLVCRSLGDALHDLVGVLGSGSESVVYKAINGDGKLVAVKSLKMHEGDRLSQEVECLDALRGVPGIPRLHGQWVVPPGGDQGGGLGTLLLEMELVDGVDLEQHMMTKYDCRGKLPSLRVVRNMAWHLLQTLAAMHAAGVIHRDIKGTNVMRVKNRARPLVLVDFGFAVKGTSAVSPSYTRYFAAPEVLLNAVVPAEDARPYNHKVDVYSLAVTLFRAAYRAWPGPGNTASDLRPLAPEERVRLLQTWSFPPTRNAKERETTQCEERALLEDLLSHMLEFDPEERWSAEKCLTHPFFRKLTNCGSSSNQNTEGHWCALV